MDTDGGGTVGAMWANTGKTGNVWANFLSVGNGIATNSARLNGTIVRATCSGKWKEKNARNRFAEMLIMIVCQNGAADSSFHSPNDFAQSPNRWITGDAGLVDTG